MHLGSGAERKDKMFRRLGELCDELQKRGYQFVTVDELLRDCITARQISPGDAEKVVEKSSNADRIFLPQLISVNN